MQAPTYGLKGRPDTTMSSANSRCRVAKLGSQAELRQEREFSASCLPLTMELADLLRQDLHRLFQEFPRKWRVHDRVLALLVPSLIEDITGFYSGSGPPMADMFSAHQIDHLDRDLLRGLLTVVEAVRPGTVSSLKHTAQRTASPEHAAQEGRS